MNEQSTKEPVNNRPVRTPPNYLLEERVCSTEYLEATKNLILVLETDGFGVVLH